MGLASACGFSGRSPNVAHAAATSPRGEELSAHSEHSSSNERERPEITAADKDRETVRFTTIILDNSG